MTDQTTNPLPQDLAASNPDAGLDSLSGALDALGAREAELAAREADLAKKLADLSTALARSQADHANLLKRLDREKDETRVWAVTRAVGKLLPAVDTLERALAHVPAGRQDDPWTLGVAAAHKAFLKGLAEADVRPFDSLGMPLDEARHEAVAHVPGPADAVVAEMEKGYLYGERVLRHAKVAVGNGEPVPSPAA